MKILTLFRRNSPVQKHMRAVGVTDHALLFSILADGTPRTLLVLTEQTGIPGPTVSARMRDFRKEGHVVDRFRMSKNHPWQYRLKPRHDLRDAVTGQFTSRTA